MLSNRWESSRLGPLYVFSDASLVRSRLTATRAKFFTHSRYLVTLRAGKQKYHSILIFRLAGSPHEAKMQVESVVSRVRAVEELQMYAMEAQCPHLGADLSHAEIEEYEDGELERRCSISRSCPD